MSHTSGFSTKKKFPDRSISKKHSHSLPFLKMQDTKISLIYSQRTEEQCVEIQLKSGFSKKRLLLILVDCVHIKL